MNDECGISLNAQQLLAYQPNRFPFLMIDYVECVVPGVRAIGFKNLTWNEWFFPQHFPGAPNMPGALQLEAMAQLLTIAITTQPGLEGKVTHALSHTVSFHREVVPGDRLDLNCTVESWRRGVAIGSATGRVGTVVACRAKMRIAIPEILDSYLPRERQT